MSPNYRDAALVSRAENRVMVPQEAPAPGSWRSWGEKPLEIEIYHPENGGFGQIYVVSCSARTAFTVRGF